MRERDYSNNPHPPTCTCVQCVQRRNDRATKGGVSGAIGRRNWSLRSWPTVLWAIIGVAVVLLIVLLLV